MKSRSYLVAPKGNLGPAPRALFATVTVLCLLAAPAAAGQLRLFHTPGANIGCELFVGKGTAGGAARCDIANRSWAPPPRPASCKLDYGNGLIVLSHGRGRFTCAGDTALHQGRALGAGHFVKAGPYKCTSLGSAVRCLNRRTKHGFEISQTLARRF
jgi:hypothetical protein